MRRVSRYGGVPDAVLAICKDEFAEIGWEYSPPDVPFSARLLFYRIART